MVAIIQISHEIRAQLLQLHHPSPSCHQHPPVLRFRTLDHQCFFLSCKSQSPLTFFNVCSLRPQFQPSFEMCSDIVLTNSRIKNLLRAPFSNSSELEYVELEYDSNIGKIVIEQFVDSELFVSCIVLDQSFRPLLRSETFLDSPLFNSLLPNRFVGPIKFIDTKICPTHSASKISASRIAMARNRLEQESKMEITVHSRSHSMQPETYLIDMFKDLSTKGQSSSNPHNPSDKKVRSQMPSITFSEKDLEYFEAQANSSVEPSSGSWTDGTRSDKHCGSEESDTHQRPAHAQDSYRSKQIKDTMTNTEQERALVQAWSRKQEMWKELSPEKGKVFATNRPTTFEVGLQAYDRPKTAGWASFASARTGQGTTIRVSNGFMQDPTRDNDRCSRFQPQSTTQGSPRQRQDRASASFKPRTNFSQARNSANRRE